MKRSVPFPLYLDPEAVTYSRLRIGRLTFARYVFDVRAWMRWLRALMLRGHGRITGHYSILPGVAVVDSDAEVRYLYRGRGLGDYPKLIDVLAQLRTVTGNI